MIPSTTRFVQHGSLRLALHDLRDTGPGRPLLFLHGLAERSPRTIPEELASWRGSIHALDFSGHGRSTLPAGGGYTAEQLMGDADAALQELASATLVGRGLGAYVALLLAGSRATRVRGAVLCDGPGLTGGGSHPLPPTPTAVDPRHHGPPDPFALLELSRDLRPPDYATAYARQATHLSELDRPITVCAVQRPEWLAAVVEEPGVEVASLEEALAHYGRVPGPDETPGES